MHTKKRHFMKEIPRKCLNLQKKEEDYCLTHLSTSYLNLKQNMIQ